jgi:MoxR-like ATPase
MVNYIFSTLLSAFLTLACGRMRRGFGAVLFLEGPPGGGKTSFAKALASHLEGHCYYYSGSPDKERDLLYEIDVEGVLKRESAWVPGPAWQAFQASKRGEFAVLLIDEVDKTNPGFDAFLLRLLEDWTFRAPNGEEIAADPTKIAVVMTSNGRRKLRPEVLRRSQRIHIPLPENGRLHRIVRQIAGITIPDGLLDLVIRIGNDVRQDEESSAPSPKELALCCVDLLALNETGEQEADIWREVAASYLTKNGGPSHLDRVTKFHWSKALKAEASKN